MRSYLVIGIDLAGSPRRPTGVCTLKALRASTTVLYSDGEVLDYVTSGDPDVVAIDAPLTLPPGRRTIEDRRGGHFRECDLELRRRRIPFFPITLGPMRSLTQRGIALKEVLTARGLDVIEIYPGGAQDLWGLPRQHRNRAGLRRGLGRLGLRGLSAKASGHELDAATGALVGRLYLKGQAEAYGREDDGIIVMPKCRMG
jgi:predicted nuclease with RNAse H fold